MVDPEVSAPAKQPLAPHRWSAAPVAPSSPSVLPGCLLPFAASKHPLFTGPAEVRPRCRPQGRPRGGAARRVGGGRWGAGAAGAAAGQGGGCRQVRWDDPGGRGGGHGDRHAGAAARKAARPQGQHHSCGTAILATNKVPALGTADHWGGQEVGMEGAPSGRRPTGGRRRRRCGGEAEPLRRRSSGSRQWSVEAARRRRQTTPQRVVKTCGRQKPKRTYDTARRCDANIAHRSALRAPRPLATSNGEQTMRDIHAPVPFPEHKRCTECCLPSVGCFSSRYAGGEVGGVPRASGS